MSKQPKKTRRGLGRGLSALIQDTSAEPDQTDSAETAASPSEADDATDKDSNKIDAAKIADTLGSRYLDNPKGTREKRRPSDLFFGADDTTSQSTKRSNGGRAAMPNPILDRARDDDENVEEEDSLLKQIPVESKIG